MFTLPNLRRDTFPRIQPTKVQISVAYPGSRAEDVEEAICRRIEDAIDAVNQVDKISCEAREGLAQAVSRCRRAVISTGSPPTSKLRSTRSPTFPIGPKDPIIKQLGLTDFVAAMAVTGFANPTALKAYAEALKARMVQDPEITKVEIEGFSDHQIRIELAEAALKQLGLSVADVARQIDGRALTCRPVR